MKHEKIFGKKGRKSIYKGEGNVQNTIPVLERAPERKPDEGAVVDTGMKMC